MIYYKEEVLDIRIKSRNIELTDALREYTLDKIKKVRKYFDGILEMEVELTYEKNPSISQNHIAEVTVFTKGPLIRAVVASPDMYASIDQVVDKLERQIKKYKGKLIDRTQQPRSTEPVADLDNNSRSGREPKIVKVKQFAVKPMTPEEAALQMELLGHDFYVFTNSETEEINVVYRRKDDNYGLIEPIYQ